MTVKQRLLLLISTVITAVAVALTYHYFELAVHHATDAIWTNWLHTDINRFLIVPLCITLTLIFFGVQHVLDRKSEKQVSEGLGQAPEASLINFAKILSIGFFSLLAGASLGPEAILVPACLVIGAFIGRKLFPKQQELIGLMTALGFVSLFAAFFNAIIAGLLGLVLIGKQTKAKLTIPLVLLSLLASISTVKTLAVVEGKAYLNLPSHVASPDPAAVLVVLLLVGVGFAITHLLSIAHRVFAEDFEFITTGAWWTRGLLAGTGLSALYLFGGPLVQFTGNQSIAPMLQQSAALGYIGLFWIFVVKILAIAWSKALGYRGGLVFPSVFVACTAVAFAQLYVSNLSFLIGFIAVMIGMLAAESKVKILIG